MKNIHLIVRANEIKTRNERINLAIPVFNQHSPHRRKLARVFAGQLSEAACVLAVLLEMRHIGYSYLIDYNPRDEFERMVDEMQRFGGYTREQIERVHGASFPDEIRQKWVSVVFPVAYYIGHDRKLRRKTYDSRFSVGVEMNLPDNEFNPVEYLENLARGKTPERIGEYRP